MSHTPTFEDLVSYSQNLMSTRFFLINHLATTDAQLAQVNKTMETLSAAQRAEELAEANQVEAAFEDFDLEMFVAEETNEFEREEDEIEEMLDWIEECIDCIEDCPWLADVDDLDYGDEYGLMCSA
jgi:hypothetical protein